MTVDFILMQETVTAVRHVWPWILTAKIDTITKDIENALFRLFNFYELMF